MSTNSTDVDTKTLSPGSACSDCMRDSGWWVHLRRCTVCGQVGCCDSSPAKHATAHYIATGHPMMPNFEPGEEWLWNYKTENISTHPLRLSISANPLGLAMHSN